MKKLIVLILFLFSSLIYSKEKILLVTGEWFPYTSEKIVGSGYFSEIVTAVFNDMGFEVEYKFFPWKRCEELVKSGEAFATFPYIITDERQKIFTFSDPVANSTGRLFYLKKNFKSEPIWTDYKSLKKYSIGGTFGYWYEAEFKKTGLKVDYSPNDEVAIKKLYSGRVNMLAIDELVGWELIKKLYPKEIDKFDVMDNPLNISELHLMISSSYANSSNLKDRFNISLSKIKKTPIYDKILKKYNIKK